MKLTYLIFLITFCSMNFYGQSDMTAKENNIDSFYTQSVERVELEDLNISLKLSKSWKVKKTDKSKSVVLLHEDTKSTINIYLTDIKSILNDLLLKSEKQDSINHSNSFATELLVGMLNEFNSLPNGTFKFSTVSSLIEGDFEVITTKLIINNQGIIVIARVGVHFEDCKKESECIIESIQNVK